jgi:hypothetical protein
MLVDTYCFLVKYNKQEREIVVPRALTIEEFQTRIETEFPLPPFQIIGLKPIPSPSFPRQLWDHDIKHKQALFIVLENILSSNVFFCYRPFLYPKKGLSSLCSNFQKRMKKFN